MVKRHLQAAVAIHQQAVAEAVDVQLLIKLLERCLAQLVSFQVEQA